MISGHGSDSHKYSQKIKADFSSNVWYKGVQIKLIKHLQDKLQNIIHYPEPNALSLSKKIAIKHKLNFYNVLVTNGATEAFYLLAQAFEKQRSYIVYPAFAEYEDACKIFKHKLRFVKINNLSDEISLQPNSLFWLGNPNNPDGLITSKETIRTLCKNNPLTFFVIDEAYAELCDESETVVSLLKEYDNLIVIHSLTKTFAMPGIRLGYVLASKKIIKLLTSIKMPWSVNYLALEAGDFILGNYEKYLPDKKNLSLKSKSFQKELNSIDGLDVKESNCNYFLIHLKKGKASDLKQFLIDEYGLLIRDASNFRGLNETYFRIAIQETSFNNILIDAINEFLNNNE